MFDWWKRLDPESSGLAAMTREFGQMLVDGRNMFEAASNALYGGTDPEVIRQSLFETDRRINAVEVKIRRAIVVHGTVHGTADLAPCLVLMSLVKDAERIGDYAKNIFDLAVQSDSWKEKSVQDDLIALKDRISTLMNSTRRAFEEQDDQGAHQALSEADRITDKCDAHIVPIVQGKASQVQAALTVLAYRYNKRVAAHCSNILTSIVMPVDQLDYLDEPKIDHD